MTFRSTNSNDKASVSCAIGTAAWASLTLEDAMSAALEDPWPFILSTAA